MAPKLIEVGSIVPTCDRTQPAQPQGEGLLVDQELLILLRGTRPETWSDTGQAGTTSTPGPALSTRQSRPIFDFAAPISGCGAATSEAEPTAALVKAKADGSTNKDETVKHFMPAVDLAALIGGPRATTSEPELTATLAKAKADGLTQRCDLMAASLDRLESVNKYGTPFETPWAARRSSHDLNNTATGLDERQMAWDSQVLSGEKPSTRRLTLACLDEDTVLAQAGVLSLPEGWPTAHSERLRSELRAAGSALAELYRAEGKRLHSELAEALAQQRELRAAGVEALARAASWSRPQMRYEVAGIIAKRLEAVRARPAEYEGKSSKSACGTPLHSGRGHGVGDLPGLKGGYSLRSGERTFEDLQRYRDALSSADKNKGRPLLGSSALRSTKQESFNLGGPEITRTSAGRSH